MSKPEIEATISNVCCCVEIIRALLHLINFMRLVLVDLIEIDILQVSWHPRPLHVDGSSIYSMPSCQDRALEG